MEQVEIATLKAAEPIHLAEIIEDEMKERGWTMDHLVMNMGPFYTEKAWGICMLSWEMFFAIRTPDITLGDEMAMELSTAFGASPIFFTTFHENWRKWAKPLSGRDDE